MTEPKAFVSLTYDDGLDTQIKYAVPALNEYGLKGSFYVSGNALIDSSKFTQWKQTAAFGHEIGIHTINHPCDISFDFVKKGFSLQDYDIKRMNDEIEENIKIVNKEFSYVPDKYTFAYPCGQSSLGPKRETSYIPLIKEKFIAARNTQWGYNDPKNMDLYDVNCFGVECSGDDMIDIVKEAEKKNLWAVFLFHGIEGEYISVTDKAHRQLLKYLADNAKTVQTNTFMIVAGFIKG